MLETSVHPRICEQIRQDRWAAGSTASPTYSRGARTRRAPSASMFEPPRSSARGWIGRASRRLTSTRRWSVASSGGCRGDRPRRARAVGRRRWQAASVCWLRTCGHGRWRRAAGRSRPHARPTSGCSASTITSCRCTAWSSGPGGCTGAMPQPLLAECAGAPTPDWSRLTVPTVAAFVQTQANRLGPSTRRSAVTATRAFLRFLATRGVIPAGIDGAVPTIRQWTHAALPRAIAAEDVQRVLAAVDVTRPSGLRDRAILLLLIRLGLRAGEVAGLAVNCVVRGILNAESSRR